MRTNILILAILACATGFCAAASIAEAQEFRHRGWVGARLPGDGADGCAMGLDIRGGGAFVVYADAKRAFRIGVASRALALKPGQEGIGAANFDDSPPILLKGAAISTTTMLFDALDLAVDGGLEKLVESSRSVMLTFQGRSLRARLSGSARAIKLLKDCASAPEAIEAEPPTAANEDAAAGGRDRAAGFGFLRQGMAIREANQKLLDAGWQADAPDGADASQGAAAALAAQGVSPSSCEGSPPVCVVEYGDAYGNSLRLTASAEGDGKVRRWRLNPPGRGADGEAAAEGQGEPPDGAPLDSAGAPGTAQGETR